MASDDEVQNALLAIHSRLGTIEGKVNLAARADRGKLIQVLEDAIKKDPLLGQIYLLLDGKRTQQDILTELKQFGISPSQATVSRRMKQLVTEYGVADLAGAVLRKDRAAEDVLNLTPRVRRWLEDGRHTVPIAATKRPRKRSQ